MSNLLLKWLNDDLQLSQHVECFESDFANGYLLGEILARHNQQHNFSDFVPSETSDAKIVNYSLLEPTIRSLGIKFDAVTATNMMNEQEGVAAKLLYQIKIAVERVQRSGMVSNRSYSIGDVVPIHNVPSKLPKHSYDSAKHRSFESSIRVHVKSVDTLQEEKLAAMADEERVREVQQKKKEYVQNLEATRQQRLHLTKIQRDFAQSSNEGETEAWAVAQARKREREDRKARYDKMLQRRKALQQEEHLEDARNQVQSGIEIFETKHGIKTPVKRPSTSSSSSKKGKSLPKQISIGYGIRSLATVFNKRDVVVPNQTPKKANATGGHDTAHTHPSHRSIDLSEDDAIRQKRTQREIRCDLQMKRRSKFVKKCDVRQHQTNEAIEMSMLESELTRSTNSETSIENKRRNIHTFMDVVIANRMYRESKYSKRRKRDEFDAITRDASAYGMIHHRYTDAVLAQNERYDRLTQAVCAATYKSHEVTCSEILNRVVDIAYQALLYRSTSTWIMPREVFLPTQTWTEYKAFFVHATDEEFRTWNPTAFHGCINHFEYMGHINTSRSTVITQWVEKIDEEVFSEPRYIRGRLYGYHVLGEIVKYVRVMNEPLPLPPARTLLPAFPLKIAMLGKPFTGRKTLSKMLCSKYNLAALSLHSLLDQAIQIRTNIGLQALTYLQAGQMLPNEIYIALLHQSISELASVNPPLQGWVLEDFVSDVNEALDLERLLSGCVPGELARTSEDRASLLAPGMGNPPLTPTYFHGKSGLDMVFLLPIERTKLYRHCLGKLVDPVNHEQFHMHSKPPPENSTTRFRLQLWSDGIIAPENLSLHAQSHDTADSALLEWFSQYDTLRHIDNKDPGSAICDHIEHFLAEKTAAIVTSQRNRDNSEAILLAAEEERMTKISTFNTAIAEAEAADANAQASLKAAEDAKAKKDELVVLKTQVEATKSALDQLLLSAAAFHRDEQPKTVSSLSTCVSAPHRLSEYLARLWSDSEQQYENVLKLCFEKYRYVREEIVRHAIHVMTSFCQFVRRIDSKQQFVDKFQEDFNQILEDMRYDDSTKAELHVRTDTLQDSLIALIEAKGIESSTELGRMIVAEGWKEVLQQILITLCNASLQAEIDRFHAAVHVIVDAISGFEQGLRAGDEPLIEMSSPPQIQLKDLHVEEEKETKKPAKKGAAAAAATPEAEPASNPEAETSQLAAKAVEACKKIIQRFLKDEKKEEGAQASAVKDVKQHGGKAIDNAKAKTDLHHDKSGGSLPPPVHKDTPGSLNATQALQFEFQLTIQRIHTLETFTLHVLQHLHGIMSKLEEDLRAMLTRRLQDERLAVQTLVTFIRSAIEDHVALPYRLVIYTEVQDRLPPHRQEIEDTQIRIDMSQRTMEKSPLPPYPIVEYLDPVYLSTNQLNALASMLKDVAMETTGRSDCVIRSVFADCFARLATLSIGLPPVWRNASLKQLMEMAALFDKKDSGIVKVFPNVTNTFQAKHKVDELMHELGLIEKE